jgi:hypothetical protein
VQLNAYLSDGFRAHSGLRQHGFSIHYERPLKSEGTGTEQDTGGTGTEQDTGGTGTEQGTGGTGTEQGTGGTGTEQGTGGTGTEQDTAELLACANDVKLLLGNINIIHRQSGTALGATKQ